jgi:hypothetical protein
MTLLGKFGLDVKDGIFFTSLRTNIRYSPPA